MVDGGNCEQAVVEHINPALSANPDDADALELRRRCTAPSPAPPPPEPEPAPTAAADTAAAPELDQVEALIAANGCSEARPACRRGACGRPEQRARHRSWLREPLPARQRRPPHLQTARCPDRRSGRQGATVRGRARPAAQELDKDYQKRKLAMRRRYDDAVSMLQRQEHQQAARAFDEIAQEVPTGYLELAQRRADAHEGIKQQAVKAFDLAQAAEKAGEFEAATDAYRRANALDPGIRIDGPLQRIEEQKIGRGRKRCDEAKVAFSYGENAAARAAFQDVLTLLPPSDPCHTLAVDRLKQLGK